MCSAIAGITDDFSLAYLQDAFISSLLVVANEQGEAGKRAEEKTQSIDSNSLESVLFWWVMSVCCEMRSKEAAKSAEDAMAYNGPKPASKAGFA